MPRARPYPRTRERRPPLPLPRPPRLRPEGPPAPLGAGLDIAAHVLPGASPPMESEMLQSPLLGLGEEDESDLTDWNLPLAFMKKRHCEKIEGSKSLAQSWRMKDRVMLQGMMGFEGGAVGGQVKRESELRGC